MNIEGAERYAIAGMEETLARTRHVCIACHDFLAGAGRGDEFRTREMIKERLRSRGFVVSSRADDPRPYVRDQVYGVRTR